MLGIARPGKTAQAFNMKHKQKHFPIYACIVAIHVCMNELCMHAESEACNAMHNREPNIFLGGTRISRCDSGTPDTRSCKHA